eukprot:2197380-Prymnesium_polylepis.1
MLPRRGAPKRCAPRLPRHGRRSRRRRVARHPTARVGRWLKPPEGDRFSAPVLRRPDRTGYVLWTRGGFGVILGGGGGGAIGDPAVWLYPG